MALSTRRRRNGIIGNEAWPGYVDALSTLLMTTIFVLLVFALAQGFLSVALSGRSKELDKANRMLAEVGNALSLEKARASSLQQSLNDLNSQLAVSNDARKSLSEQLQALNERINQTVAEREGLKTQLAGATETAKASTSKAEQLQADLATAQQQLADMKAEQDRLNKTVLTDQATIQARLADLAKLNEEVRALTALRDQLEAKAQNAAVAATTEQERRAAVEAELAKEHKLGESATAQIALLNKQLDQVRAQLASLAQSLDIAKKAGHEKDVQIADLGAKLNVALAAKVQELQQYRSDFFGTLRKVLEGESGIRIVGDRFVMQSDVLFPTGSAELTASGVVEISKLAETVKHIAQKIPPNVEWILDVDGYADRQPITGGQYASNWELSVARAISVVNLLIKEGVPQDHIAATGFGDNHPLEAGDAPDAYAKNRRIELRLTDYAKATQSP
jgi:chemotaxis protein MotB